MDKKKARLIIYTAILSAVLSLFNVHTILASAPKPSIPGVPKGGPNPTAPTNLVNIMCTDNRINTAIGCIPATDSSEFIAFIFRWAIGIGGGVSFMLIIYSGLLFMTSSGDTKKVQAARELLTAAVSGLILLVFTMIILRILGVDILRIFPA